MSTEDPKIETEVPKSDAPVAKPDARRRMLRKTAGVVAGFAAVGTVLAGLTGYWTTYRTVTKEILAPVKPEPIAPRLSLVVLPFTNLTGDPAQDYLGDVITEELTTSLSRIPHSFVIARSTAFTYKGKAVDVKQIGRDLGVRYILEGSQEQGGNQLRVNAQLIDADTGAHLWQINSMRIVPISLTCAIRSQRDFRGPCRFASSKWMPLALCKPILAMRMPSS